MVKSRLKTGDTVKYSDLQDLAALVRSLNREGYDYLIDFGSRTVHIRDCRREIHG